MRTTLTLDEDIARLLKQISKRRDTSFKQVVNDALRLGLNQLTARSQHPSSPFSTEPVRLGARLPNLDNVAEVLAVTETEDYR